MYYKVKKDEAVAIMHNCPISLKFAIELAREIRGKPVNKVLAYLEDITELVRHVPLRRYNRDVGHKKGTTISGTKSGRYPVKVARYFIKVINSAISNASNKGLDKANLLLRGAFLSQGQARVRVQPQGKKRTRAYKGHSANIEIVVAEIRKKKLDKKAKVEKKTEVKTTEAKAEKKNVVKKVNLRKSD